MTGVLQPLVPIPGVPDPAVHVGSADELLAFYEGGCKEVGKRLLGVETERLPMLGDATACPYAAPPGQPSVTALLRFLQQRLGGSPTEQDGNVLGLTLAEANVHLEPGGQVELALAPKRSAREVLAALRAWKAALEEGAAATGVHAVALGLQPMTPVADIGWVPKPRYPIMSRHLAARGRLAHHMMKATASLQVSVDYTSEADAGSIMRTALAVSPLVNALVVHSPLEGGVPNGLLSKRHAIWLETDPERTGLLPWVHDEPWSFRRWIDWTLDAPVMFVVRQGAFRTLDGRSFRQFIDQGGGDAGPATHADYQLHVTTLFPEVRLKQHVEIRGADSVGPELSAAVVALWRGVLYDTRARDGALGLLPEDLSAAERTALHLEVGRLGPAATVRGRPLRDLAASLIDLAAAGLPADEAELLSPLQRVASTGLTPAHDLLAAWAPTHPEVLLSER